MDNARQCKQPLLRPPCRDFLGGNNPQHCKQEHAGYHCRPKAQPLKYRPCFCPKKAADKKFPQKPDLVNPENAAGQSHHNLDGMPCLIRVIHHCKQPQCMLIPFFCPFPYLAFRYLLQCGKEPVKRPCHRHQYKKYYQPYGRAATIVHSSCSFCICILKHLKYTIFMDISQDLCIQFQTDFKRPVDFPQYFAVKAAYPVLKPLLVNGAELFQKYHGIFHQVVFRRL